MSLLSVVIPAFNEEQMISRMCDEVSRVLEGADISYELVFVNDGSTDRTAEAIEHQSAKDPRITGIQFSRNFGKEAAILAGLAYASGDVVAVMDCDLQHPPETLTEMYARWQEGFQVIEGIKKNRGEESFFHKESAGFFYRIMSGIMKVDMENTSDFKMLDRQVVKTILSMPEQKMFFRAVSSWVGYRTTTVEFEVHERAAGRSKWTLGSLIRYAFTNIASFTTVPLQFISLAGGACFMGSLILILYSLVQYFRGHAVEGYTTTILVMLLIGSAVMLSLGVIGFYIARIYEEVRRRPRYIVSGIIKGKTEKTEDKRIMGEKNETN